MSDSFVIFVSKYIRNILEIYQKLVECIHESYKRHTLCGSILFHFWAV